MGEMIFYVYVGIAVFLFFVIFVFIASIYKKVIQGQALVRTGVGGTKISFEGLIVIPIFQRMEVMDISVKKIEINRQHEDGLICKDNIRADIKVAFFVRVNKTNEDVTKVAQTIGCARASNPETLNTLFEAKFSEALKTVGKQFNFEELYNSREQFKQEILNVIGRDLNGYILDDAAIDYLEQTDVSYLKANNILDAQGIKKITELAATENMLANAIRREEEKTIKKQDTEAEEAILELDKQLAEKRAIQQREIATIEAREQAETKKVQQEESLKAKLAEIRVQEESDIAKQNKERQVIVATKQKERTEAIETEKVEKDRMLEVTEREKIVTLAQIEKEKEVEVERRNIQEVIRDRVEVERSTVEEEEKIKDTKAFAEAERNKTVAVTKANEEAEQHMVKTIKAAEAQKEAAKVEAEKKLIDAEAAKNAAVKDAEAKKILAEAKAAEEAALGKSEAQVIEAKANAAEKEGLVEATLIEKKALAEAIAIEAKAEADKKRGLIEAEVLEKQGLAEAKVIAEQADAKALEIEKQALAEAKGIEQKGLAEAKGVEAKAEAMKKLDGVGKEHEEFKLRLEKDKSIDLAAIEVQRAVAEAQAKALQEAFKSSKIDIVGGETMFYENVLKAITRGKTIDRTINNSNNLQLLSNNLLEGDTSVIKKIRGFIDKFGLSTNDVKNLTIANLLFKLSQLSNDKETTDTISQLNTMVTKAGWGDKLVNTLDL